MRPDKWLQPSLCAAADSSCYMQTGAGFSTGLQTTLDSSVILKRNSNICLYRKDELRQLRQMSVHLINPAFQLRTQVSIRIKYSACYRMLAKAYTWIAAMAALLPFLASLERSRGVATFDPMSWRQHCTWWWWIDRDYLSIPLSFPHKVISRTHWICAHNVSNSPSSQNSKAKPKCDVSSSVVPTSPVCLTL